MQSKIPCGNSKAISFPIVRVRSDGVIAMKCPFCTEGHLTPSNQYEAIHCNDCGRYFERERDLLTEVSFAVQAIDSHSTTWAERRAQSIKNLEARQARMACRMAQVRK